MQFVTGGAFNGKSSWVRAYTQMNGGSTSWISAYHQSLLPLSLDHLDENVVVIEGIEQWIKELLIEFEAEAVLENGKRFWKNGRFGKAEIKEEWLF